MKEIIKKLLLTADKFISEWHVRQPEFTYSACVSFVKHCEILRKFKERSDLKHIYKKKNLDKAGFANDSVYANSKGLAQRTISDKNLT